MTIRRDLTAAVLILAALGAGGLPEAAAKDPAMPIAVPCRGDAVLRGRVLGEGGATVSGAEVRVYREMDLIRIGADFATSADPVVPEGTAKATSGSDGAFEIGGLVAAAYVLRVAAPGRGLGVFRGSVAAPGGGPALELTLPAAFALEGDVVDGAGKGVPNAVVCARLAIDDQAHPEHLVASRVVARADADGRFRLEGLPTRAGGDVVSRLMLSARSGDGSSMALRLAAVPLKGPRVDPLVLAGAAVVEGTVLDETKSPLAGAHVVVLLGGEGDPMRSLVCTAVTGPDGGFRMAGLAPGPVEFLTVLAPGIGALAGPPSSATSAKDGQTARFTFEMRRGHSVGGLVVGPKGSPMTGLGILAWRRESAFAVSTTTGADGRYQIDGLPWQEAGTPDPNAVLVLCAPGWVVTDERDLRPRVSGRAGPVLRGGFRLEAGAAIEGRVLDAAGAPVADAVVAVAHPDGTPTQDPWGIVVRTGRDGSFRVPDLYDGPYALRATHPALPGAAEAVVRISIGAGMPKAPPLEMRFSASSPIPPGGR